MVPYVLPTPSTKASTQGPGPHLWVILCTPRMQAANAHGSSRQKDSPGHAEHNGHRNGTPEHGVGVQLESHRWAFS